MDEFNTALEPLHGRIDEKLKEKLKEKAQNYENNLIFKVNRFQWEKPTKFPSESIIEYMDAYKQKLQYTEINTFVCNKHKKDLLIKMKIL